MSKNAKTDMPTCPVSAEQQPDRSAPYAVQFEPVIEYVHRCITQGTGHITVPLDPAALGDGRIEWSKGYAMHTFTRTDLYAALSLAADNAREAGPQALTLPNGRTGSGRVNRDLLMRSLVERYTPKRGSNANRSVLALLQGLAAHRKALKRAANAAAIEAAVTHDYAFKAEGVFVMTTLTDADGKTVKGEDGKAVRVPEQDADGKPRSKAFPNNEKAMKAWCRAVYGDDWWEQDKQARLIEAAGKVSLYSA